MTQELVGEEKKYSNDDDVAETEVKDEVKKQSMVWLVWAFSAAILFAACNEGISEITQAKGLACLFYFAPGCILIGVVYELISCCNNKCSE